MKKLILILIIIFICVAGVFYFWEKSQTNSEQEQTNNKEVSCFKEYEKIEISSLDDSTNKECCEGLIAWEYSDSVFYCLKSDKDEIFINSPKENEKIKSPLKIEGKAKSSWFFNSQLKAELYGYGYGYMYVLGKAVLKAKGNSTTEDFVPFEGELKFDKPEENLIGVLRFFNDNPSGLPENQKFFDMEVQLPRKYMLVLLYYYNPLEDQDAEGNIKCSRDGLFPIMRHIELKDDMTINDIIKETINLLLKGKENLNEEDISLGITTEYPLDGFKLKSLDLTPDGTLFLEFNDPLKKTSGRGCRSDILWYQIEATAAQFYEVKKVRRVKYFPENLFSP